MRLWLDDERPAPDGWVRVLHPTVANRLLAEETVEEISLDHDLGIWENGVELTGYHVLLWIEEMVATDPSYQPPATIRVHSGNAGVRKKMNLAIESIDRLLQKRSG